MSYSARQNYCELIKSPTPIHPAHNRPVLLPSARALVQRAIEHERLDIDGPWRLASHECRALERSTQTVPPGGWRGLCSLLAGTGLIRTGADAFFPTASSASIYKWDEATTRRKLTEAFTMRLVPPSTAAGLFLLVGLHPAWGLKLASISHEQVPEISPVGSRRAAQLSDPNKFPPRAIRAARQGFFATISIIIEALRTLDADRAYPIDALARVIADAAEFGRVLVQQELPPQLAQPPMIPIFIDQIVGPLPGLEQRSIDFTTHDLLDNFLVPAGVVRRFDQHTFCVWPELISDDTEIFEHGALGEHALLWQMLEASGALFAS